MGRRMPGMASSSPREFRDSSVKVRYLKTNSSARLQITVRVTGSVR